MIDSTTHADQILSLMQTLIEYRQQRIHGELENVKTKYSMLHLDVLLLLYHFAKIGPGAILEIGASLGGATIAMALGVASSGGVRKLISIERGGKLEHPRLASKDKIRDLQRNLAKENVSRLVTLIEGDSAEEATIASVRRALGPEQIGLLVIDADGAIERDINCYEDLLAHGCWIVIDDYFGPAENFKVPPTRRAVDALVAREALAPLGYYGWGTWIGSWEARR